MDKEYEALMIETIVFETADVITASPNEGEAD